MKLHAKITSERGKPVTKSGNEYLEVLVNNEQRENVYMFTVEKRENEIYAEVINYSTGEKHIFSDS